MCSTDTTEYQTFGQTCEDYATQSEPIQKREILTIVSKHHSETGVAGQKASQGWSRMETWKRPQYPDVGGAGVWAQWPEVTGEQVLSKGDLKHTA